MLTCMWQQLCIWHKFESNACCLAAVTSYVAAAFLATNKNSFIGDWKTRRMHIWGCFKTCCRQLHVIFIFGTNRTHKCMYSYSSHKCGSSLTSICTELWHLQQAQQINFDIRWFAKPDMLSLLSAATATAIQTNSIKYVFSERLWCKKIDVCTRARLLHAHSFLPHLLPLLQPITATRL